MKRLEQQGERPTCAAALGIEIRGPALEGRPLPVKVMLFAQCLVATKECGCRATYVAKRQRFRRLGILPDRMA